MDMGTNVGTRKSLSHALLDDIGLFLLPRFLSGTPFSSALRTRVPIYSRNLRFIYLRFASRFENAISFGILVASFLWNNPGRGRGRFTVS